MDDHRWDPVCDWNPQENKFIYFFSSEECQRSLELALVNAPVRASSSALLECVLVACRPWSGPGPMAVSVLTGEVNRTWRFVDSAGRRHEASLYHHTISGARAAMIDFEELPGSIGTSSVLSSTDTIPFSFPPIDGQGNIERGHFLIRRQGYTSFRYECVFEGRAIPESTTSTGGGGGMVDDDLRFEVRMLEPVTLRSGR